MTNGSEHERQPAPEPTFADVMNGFSLDSGGRSKRRRWGNKRGSAPQQPAPPPPQQPAPPSPESFTGPMAIHAPDAGPVMESMAASVRPYTWTRGRTKSGYYLGIETLVSTSPRARERLALAQVEHRAVAELCEQTRSVAEVAALLPVPLGVARVLLGDMAGLGLVVVHHTTGADGGAPDLALMERVLSGLRRL